MILRAKAGAVLAALAAITASHVVGDDASVRRRATLEFRVVATASRSATHPIGSFVSGVLEEGASTGTHMQVKLIPARDGTPCRSTVTMGPADAPDGPFPLWQVEAVVRRVEMDKILVGYSWKRRSESGPGSPSDREGRGEATLSEDGRVLLDFVPTTVASARCYSNVALEVAASIPEDPALQDRRIGYDLWLVRENHGTRLTRRLQLIGKQGEKVGFDYGMFRSHLPAGTRPEGASDVMEMTVSGYIRGRIQADRSIELLLVAHRGARPDDGGWATAAHGEKQVRAATGETLRLELPPPASFAGANEPETFKAIAEQRVALVLTPQLVE